MLRLIYSPARALDEVQQGRRWIYLLIWLSLLTAALTYLMQPYLERAVQFQLAPLVSPAELSQLMASGRNWARFGYIFIPFTLLAKTVLKAGLAVLAAFLLLGIRLKLGATARLYLASAFVFICHGIVSLSVLIYRGLDGIRSTGDLEVRLGLNLFIEAADPRLESLLGNINPFELWFLALVSWGIVRLQRCRMATAWLITTPGWVLGLLVEMQLQRFLTGFNPGSSW